MSPDKITEARMKYAGFSSEDLNSFKVNELRSIAPKVGLSVISRDGVPIKVGYARKNELTQAICDACKAYSVNNDTQIEETVVKIEASEYPDYESELNQVAEIYYEGVFDTTLKAHQNPWKFVGLKECVTRAIAQNKVFVPEFFTLVSSLKPELESRIAARVGKPEVNVKTLHNWRSQVLKRIERKVQRDSSNFPNDELKKAYANFYSSVQATFEVVRRERVESTTTNLNKRQESAIDVKVHNLIEWAKDTVSNLPESPAKWREVAIAIMILTGRRQSEVMSSAVFNPTESEHYVLFAGQLKRHDGENVEALEIPVLGGKGSAVINALKWLEENNKRVIPTDSSVEAQQVAAKKAHDRFSRYLSETAKDVCKLIEINPDATWTVERESGKAKDRRNCHLFRQIYGQVVIPVFFPSIGGVGRKPRQILTEVMGHSDRASSQKHAAEAYDADVFVIDIEDVKTANPHP